MKIIYKDKPEDAFARIAAGMREWRERTDIARELIFEAKEREIWKLKYDTFSEFCEKECGITRRWATELISTHKTIKEIQAVQRVISSNSPKNGKSLANSQNDGKSLPASEATSLAILQNLSPEQVKPMKGLSPGQKEAVLTAAVAASEGQNPSVKAIQSEVDKIKTPKAVPANPPIELDKKGAPIVRDTIGYPIPEEAHEFWDRRAEIQELLTLVSKVKNAITKGHSSSDPIYRAVHQGTIDHLSRAYQFLTEAKPYAVCLYCHGHFKLNNGCRNCYGTGLTSKHGYEIVGDQGVRKVREAGLAKAKK